MLETNYDVVVVGARCAGSSLARLTAQAGLRTLAVDRSTFPSDVVSTHSISAHGSMLLQRWGLFDAVIAAGTPNPRQMRVQAPGLDMTVPVPDGNPGFLAPRRTVLDKLLVDAARGGGAEVWESTAVLGFERDNEGRIRVRCRRRDGVEATVVAPMVVGADGVDSKVAKTFGATEYCVRPSHDSGVYAYYDNIDLHDMVVGFGEGSLVLAFPTNDRQVCVAVTQHSSKFAGLHAGGDASVLQVASAVAPAVVEAVAGGRRASGFRLFKARPGFYRQAGGRGWALVGDAGHYSDPFTGQGIANAFLGSHLLAAALVDGLGGAVDLAAALVDYQRQRDELTRPIHESTHRLAAFDWDNSAGVSLFLEWRSQLEQLRTQMTSLIATEPAAAGHAVA